jgi:hypothetical protein
MMRPTTWSKTWSRAEDAVVRARYLSDCCDPISRDLGRSKSAVFHRARRLGLLKNRRWTQADDAALRYAWGEGTLRYVAKKLGRSPLTTYWRAQKLGLGLGCPDGYEYLTQAAERTGYTSTQLRRILRWAGIKVRRSMSRNPKTVGRVPHFVEPFDVDVAVSRWLSTETVQHAARRYGVSGDTVRRWLEQAGREGYRVPPKPQRFKAHWRVDSETIDAIVAGRRQRRSA